jgi:hypothetical protein
MSDGKHAAKAGPAWGVAFGLLMTVTAAALWWRGSLIMPDPDDESLAVAALLIGVFSVVYAGREWLRERKHLARK